MHEAEGLRDIPNGKQIRIDDVIITYFEQCRGEVFEDAISTLYCGRKRCIMAYRSFSSTKPARFILVLQEFLFWIQVAVRESVHFEEVEHRHPKHHRQHDWWNPVVRPSVFHPHIPRSFTTW